MAGVEIFEERSIRVLAAKDSAVMQGVLRKLFVMRGEDLCSERSRMELCGLARNRVECLAAVKLAQNQASSAVWGMSGWVTEAGIARSTLPHSMIADDMERWVRTGRTAPASVLTTVMPARREGLYGLL